MQISFISIQSSYAEAKLALFRGEICLEKVFKKDDRASSHLIPYIDELLKRNSLLLSDLAFMAVDKGPGAFTSLRVTITTVNGIGFTKKIPLIGVDGLDALSLDFLTQFQEANLLVAILNAYSNDVYYSINSREKTLEKGCKKIDKLLDEIKKKYSGEKIFFTGNGTILHKGLILEALGGCAEIPSQIQETASAETIGLIALKQFNQQSQPVYTIKPNYIKTQLFATRKPLFKK